MKFCLFYQKNQKQLFVDQNWFILMEVFNFQQEDFLTSKLKLPIRRFLINSRLNLYHLGADLNHKKIQPVDWVLGACMLIRCKAIEEIGFFDENYYLYVEDIDLCFCAWKKIWQVWYVPKAKVIHHYQAKSDKNFLSIYNWHHFRSMFWYYWKNILRFKK
jgi:GT2 family glycosyltransferase